MAIRDRPEVSAHVIPRDESELEARLSEPTPAVIEALRACEGDVLVLGAGGKMGPSLTRMVRRGADEAGRPRRVMAVSRFSTEAAATRLQQHGVEVLRADLGDPAAIRALPEAPNVIYMAGQKFGTSEAPSRTWFANTAIPAWVADRYRSSRIVAFSTGNVYGLTPTGRSGSRESDRLAPLGEYAASCVGRERVFEYAAHTWGTRVAIIRLNYAVDLRYGVLVDIASRVKRGLPVNLEMGWFNCIWQGDANAMAVASLPLASTPAEVINVAGIDRLSVRDLATAFARRFGTSAIFEGAEAGDALLSDTGRMQSLFGPPRVSSGELVDMVGGWIERGGAMLGKPTHFEERGGAF